MTPEAQRIAIAEACGWTFASSCDNAHGVAQPEYWSHDGTDEIAYEATDLPDYLTDLNAMHEAEKVLTDEQRCEYAWLLAQLVGDAFATWKAHEYDIIGCWEMSLYGCWDCAHATAPQRAEAFLRTLGKWEETK